MPQTFAYIMENYKLLEALRSEQDYAVELVLGTDRKTYIRRRIRNNLAPYDQLQLVESYYVAKTIYVVQQKQETIVLEEYVQGASLEELLSQGKVFSESEVESIALDLSYGLEAIHSLGIIHRDIKPANIILQENGHVKIIDFNAARMLNSGKRHDTQILGTEGYAPPEQYGFMTTDQRSDWYAVGKTLNELMGSNYNGKLSTVINKCMRFDPQERVGSAEEFRSLMAAKKKSYLYLGTIALALLLGLVIYWHQCNLSKGVKPSPNVAGETNKGKNSQDVAVEKAAPSSASQQALEKIVSSSTAKAEEGRQKLFNPRWEDRKKLIDANTPLRLLEAQPFKLKALKPAGTYPRELTLSGEQALQPFSLFQREKNIEQAFLVLEFEDFTILPPSKETTPYLGKFKEHMNFTVQGNINTGVTLKLTRYWKQYWKPYNYIYPIIGNHEFKYYQLGPKPSIRAKLIFPDGQNLSRTVPINVY